MKHRILDYINEVLINLEINEFSTANIIDIQNKTFKTNCSGIIKYLLNKCDRKLASSKAYEIFEELKPIAFSNVDSLRPGDIIMWRKNNIPQKGSTGHLAVFLEEISKDKDSITVKVFDSSKRPHDNDSRSSSGIGIGCMRILTEEGRATGFIWSKVEKKTKFTEILFVTP